MYLAYTDLLSYRDINREVDQLYRAFLDTTLIELARDAGGSAEYWHGVAEFRRENVDPLDRPTLAKASSAGAHSAASERRSQPASDELSHSHGFVYWFDVRAKYWAEAGADSDTLRLLASAEVVELVYEEARVLQKKIAAAEAVPKGLVRAPSDGSKGPLPLPHEIDCARAERSAYLIKKVVDAAKGVKATKALPRRARE